MSVRLDRLQRGLFEAFSGVAPTVLWAGAQVPHQQLVDAGDVLSLRVVSGPVNHNQDHARGTVLLPATSIVVRVTGTTEGVRNVVKLNGYRYSRDTTDVDTLTTIRDALLADIQAGEAGVVTATADGADGISLVGDFLGGLRRLELVGELGNDAPVFSGNAVLETEGTVTYLVSVQAFSKGREPRNGATAVIGTAQDRLQSVDVVAELERFGVALWSRGAPTNLDAIAGANWETRSAFDVMVACRSVWVRPVDQIDTASITVAVPPHGSFSASATAP